MAFSTVRLPQYSVTSSHSLIPAVHVLERGDLRRNKEKMGPNIPRLFSHGVDLTPTGPSGLHHRKKCALWLTRPDDPLTARVMVNRLWQWHFGQGIVRSSNDFGREGQLPSHPELLDWLATEFVRRGWNLKSMHRLIMLSST